MEEFQGLVAIDTSFNPNLLVGFGIRDRLNMDI